MSASYAENLRHECERILLEAEAHARVISALLAERKKFVEQLILRGCRTSANEMVRPHETAVEDCKDGVAQIRRVLREPQTDIFEIEVLLRRAKTLNARVAEQKFIINKEKLSPRAVEEEAARLLISIKVARLHETIDRLHQYIHMCDFVPRELVLIFTRIETELWSYGDEPPSSSFTAMYAYEKTIDDLIFRVNVLEQSFKAQ